MNDYDSENFDPPAPVAHVTLRNPATGDALTNVPMLLDIGFAFPKQNIQRGIFVD